ncbi:MAG: PQQ-binding-like beta-propeller repeat protein [Pirellulales bacterium]
MKRRDFLSLSSLTVGGLCFANASNTLAADWTQWRGPSRDGKLADTNWPDSISPENCKQKWRVECGPSYSGPIVVGDRIFTTETKDKQFEVVKAIDRATGQTVWEASWEGAMSVPFFAKSNGDWIRSTPAYDSGKLYVAGMRDVLVCLDANSGKIDWKVDFVKELGTPLPDFGFVCSPLVDGNFVYVQAGGALAKLDKTTGSILWRALEDGGGMNGSAFSSPALAVIGGKRQLVVQTRTTLAGVDENTGQKLWAKEIAAFRGMNILTPTFFGDAIFTSSYGGKSQLVNIKRDGNAWSTEEKWEYKAEGYMSTPVIIDGHAYLHLKNQRFTCINLSTGEAAWTTRPFGKYWSMVSSGDKILALDANGTLFLIRANPTKYEQLASMKLSDQENWAHIAVSDQQLVIRELKALSLWDWK